MKKILLFASVVALVTMESCSEQKTTATTFKTVSADTVNVKVKQVESREVAQMQEFSATVEAYKTNDIAPQSPVRIRKVNVEVGDHVRAGQVLATFDDASLNQVKVQLETKRMEFQRLDELFKIGGISKSSWDLAKMEVDVLETQYKNLVENTTLSSPISGVVSARNYDAGDLYSGNPVYVVQQINPCKILIDVNERYYSLFKVGTKIEHISLDAYPGEEFQGKVSIVYPTLSSVTRTFQVEVTIPNAKERVRPGMFARVNFDFGSENKVCVPDQAVVKQAGSGERYVYVVNEGKAYRKIIDLGRRIGDEYEINSGLQPGETVVVFGQTLLADGRDVRILN